MVSVSSGLKRFLVAVSTLVWFSVACAKTRMSMYPTGLVSAGFGMSFPLWVYFGVPPFRSFVSVTYLAIDIMLQLVLDGFFHTFVLC